MPRINNSKKKLSDNSYLRYSGLAFQIVAAILLGFFVGKWLDDKLQLKIPWFKMTLSFGAVILSLYQLVKEISSNQDD